MQIKALRDEEYGRPISLDPLRETKFGPIPGLADAMLDAGVAEYMTWDHENDDPRQIVAGVYHAMLAAVLAKLTPQRQGEKTARFPP